MTDTRSRLQAPPERRERLEDRYRKIGIPALAAALDVSRPAEKKERKQMSAEQPEWMVLDAQS